MNSSDEICRIAFTGGPCSGKTSLFTRVLKELPERGVTVLMVPEVATIHWNSGITIGDVIKDSESVFAFEGGILDMQIFFEDHFKKLLILKSPDEKLPPGPKLLIFDRGIFDIAAYMKPEEFIRLLGSRGLNPDVIHRRYNAVIYLVSAAEGASEHYSCDNNPGRYEKTIDQALETEARTKNVWIGHPKLCFVHNVIDGKKIDFKTKLDRAIAVIYRTLNMPVPLEIEHKFLVPLEIDPRSFPVPTRMTRITQTYLRPDGDGAIRRLREGCGEEASATLRTYTEKRLIRPGIREVIERQVTDSEYFNLLREADPAANPIIKLRFSFVWDNQYFQFDWITRPDNLNILEVKPTEENDKIVLPPFVAGAIEVTDREDSYGNAAIAGGRCPGYKV